MNPTDFDASEVIPYVSATSIGRLKTAMEQGKVFVSAWRLCDQNVVQRRGEIEDGCGCGCQPAD